MKVLVACEFSATVRDAFNARGHEAWSCDLIPCIKGGWRHRQCDVSEVLGEGWDLLIAHPPCTYLTNSAEWAYKDRDFARYPGVGYHQKVKQDTLTGFERRVARNKAVRFFLSLWNSGIPRFCIENPVGHMAQHLPAGARQTIQPYNFGEDASKATCLWIRGLPPLSGTRCVPPRMVDGKPRWANQTDGGQNKLSPGDDRWVLRSLTYQGIADAMASQWGDPQHIP